MKYQVSKQYLTKPSKRRSGLAVSPSIKFIVAHDIGNPSSTANNNVRYYERTRDEKSQSAHIFVDDREIIECIPALEISEAEKAWHVLYQVQNDDHLFGFDANDAAMGIEYCYGGRIDADEAYRKYVWVMAYACYLYRLDPSKSVVGHFFLDPTRKTDPVTGLAHSRRTYEQLLRDIAIEFRDCSDEVVLTAENAESQTGKVKSTVRLNIREGAPSTRAPVYRVVAPGTELFYVEMVRDGEPINGNPVWYSDENGNFFWSGGVIA